MIRRAMPWSFMIERVLIGCYTVLFAYFIYNYMFEGNIDEQFFQFTNNMDYLTFVIVGASVYTFAVSTLMNVGRSLMTELREGTLETLLLSPGSRIGYFLGTFLEQFIRSLSEFVVILLFGWILGANLTNINPLSFIVVFVLVMIGFFSQGVFLASLMLYVRDTFIIQNTLFFAMSFLGGMTFPVQYLPVALQHVSYIFPLTYALHLFRSVVIGGQSIILHVITVFELLCVSVTYVIIGFVWLSKVERKLIETSF